MTDPRRRTTIRLPVPTGPDSAHFAYHQLRWLYQATQEALGEASSCTRRAIQQQAMDSWAVLLPEKIPQNIQAGFIPELLVP